jgi:hypothetical protein
MKNFLEMTMNANLFSRELDDVLKRAAAGLSLAREIEDALVRAATECPERLWR